MSIYRANPQTDDSRSDLGNIAMIIAEMMKGAREGKDAKSDRALKEENAAALREEREARAEERRQQTQDAKDEAERLTNFQKASSRLGGMNPSIQSEIQENVQIEGERPQDKTNPFAIGEMQGPGAPVNVMQGTGKYEAIDNPEWDPAVRDAYSKASVLKKMPNEAAMWGLQNASSLSMAKQDKNNAAKSARQEDQQAATSTENDKKIASREMLAGEARKLGYGRLSAMLRGQDLSNEDRDLAREELGAWRATQNENTDLGRELRQAVSSNFFNPVAGNWPKRPGMPKPKADSPAPGSTAAQTGGEKDDASGGAAPSMQSIADAHPDWTPKQVVAELKKQKSAK